MTNIALNNIFVLTYKTVNKPININIHISTLLNHYTHIFSKETTTLLL